MQKLDTYCHCCGGKFFAPPDVPRAWQCPSCGTWFCERCYSVEVKPEKRCHACRVDKPFTDPHLFQDFHRPPGF